MKKILSIFKGTALIGGFLLCMANSRLVGAAVSEAAERCLVTVIPSLYAMLIVSSVIVRSGICSCVPRFTDRFSKFIFGMDGFAMTVFTFGTFAGYPVGTSMLLTEYESGRISKRRTELLSGLCCGAGPAFVFGCISGKLYSSDTAGIIITVSVSLANFVLALIMSPLLKRENFQQNTVKRFELSAETLTESILSSGRAMANICFTITAFSVVSAFMESLGFSRNIGSLLAKMSGLPEKTAAALFSTFLDVTNVNALPCGDFTILPYICGLTSFGGVCVIFQLAALINGRISVKPFLLIRVSAGLLSGIICRIVTPFFLRHELAAVSMIKFHAHQADSPVPSLMLIIMTFMLFFSYGKFAEKQTKSGSLH